MGKAIDDYLAAVPGAPYAKAAIEAAGGMTVPGEGEATPLQALARGFLGMTTAGFAPELTGRIDALVNSLRGKKTTVGEEVEAARKRFKKTAEDQPIFSALGKVPGAIAQAVIGQGPVLGGAMGLFQAAGEAGGVPTPKQAAVGMTVGTLGGALGKGALKSMRTAPERLSERAINKAVEGADKATRKAVHAEKALAKEILKKNQLERLADSPEELKAGLQGVKATVRERVDQIEEIAKQKNPVITTGDTMAARLKALREKYPVETRPAQRAKLEEQIEYAERVPEEIIERLPGKRPPGVKVTYPARPKQVPLRPFEEVKKTKQDMFHRGYSSGGQFSPSEAKELSRDVGQAAKEAVEEHVAKTVVKTDLPEHIQKEMGGMSPAQYFRMKNKELQQIIDLEEAQGQRILGTFGKKDPSQRLVLGTTIKSIIPRALGKVAYEEGIPAVRTSFLSAMAKAEEARRGGGLAGPALGLGQRSVAALPLAAGLGTLEEYGPIPR